MHIKQLIIQGFKSYKDKTIIDPFDAHFNLVLGKNGSGKSNILDAIQFVLSDKYANLRTDERQRLLHAGSGRNVQSATVEIIFDNKDRRIPLDLDTVKIKRHIGRQKDEYFISNAKERRHHNQNNNDGYKHCRKSEIIDLLESAGLSRYNPYNIVEQGKVTQLTNMSEKQRLELLMEIAGTRTYDDRRRESMKIMSDTDARRDRINEVVEFIEERLSELSDEKEELNEYQELDLTRRSLEYTIYDKELNNARVRLDALVDTHNDIIENMSGLHDELSTKNEEYAQTIEQFEYSNEHKERYQRELKQLDEENRQLLANKIESDLRIKDINERLKVKEETNEYVRNELQTITNEIEKVTTKLDTLKNDYETKVKNERLERERLNALKQRSQELYAKQSRQVQFNTKDERDEYIENEMKLLQNEIVNGQRVEVELQSNMKDTTLKHKEITTIMKRNDVRLNEYKHTMEEIDGKLDEYKNERNDASNIRKESWRIEEKLNEEYNDAKKNVQRAERDIQYSMDKYTYKGLQNIRRIVEREKIPGVYGPLIELFKCSSQFSKCVETIGGNSLFHVVVESDVIAARLIRIMNREKCGRITFIPLNKLRAENISYPSGSDTVPMLGKLSYDPKYKRAMQQVFGKAVIVRNLELGPRIAKQYQLNAITLDGDQVNRRGAITGGYVDYKRSRLQAQHDLSESTNMLHTIKKKMTEQKLIAQKADQKVGEILGEIQKLSSTKRSKRNEMLQLQQDQLSYEKELEIVNNSLKQIRIHQDTNERNLRSLNERQQAFENELNSEMKSDLTNEEQELLHAWNNEIEQLQEKLNVLEQERMDAEIQKNLIQTQLSDNLYKRRDELQQMNIMNDSNDELYEQLDMEQQVYNELNQRLIDIENMYKDIDVKYTNELKNARQWQTKMEALKENVNEITNKLAEESKNTERLHSKRSLLQQKCDDCTKKIHELGIIHNDDGDGGLYARKNVNQLMNMLEHNNEKLKKFSHVNKKAFDQFMSFTTRRDELIVRKKDLETSRKSIIDLIENLDRQKDEAIARTFKIIAKHFSNVFKELVPNGFAKLVITTNIGDDDDDDDDDEEEEVKRNDDEINASHYTGVAMEVSFTGGKQRMRQLSGGQRTVVALSLIFAIQRCDPSPFYVFDEIDFNLDNQHRSSVAQMIRRQAEAVDISEEGTQFICTTQNREMLETADQIYGVTFANTVSNVAIIDLESAYNLMKQIEEDGENIQHDNVEEDVSVERGKKRLRMNDDDDDDGVVTSV